MEWLIVFLLIVGLLFVWAWKSGKKAELARESREARREEERELTAAAEARRDHFELELEENWPIREQTKGSRFRDYLMMSKDQTHLRLADVIFHPDLHMKKDYLIPVRSLVSVELQQSSETIMRLETTTSMKKNSPLLRAAVGGLAFGGAGAVVGAVSAGGTSTGTTTSKSETKKGPIYLVIGTTDIHSPLHKHWMPNMDVAEQWLHRIRGAIAIASRENDSERPE